MIEYRTGIGQDSHRFLDKHAPLGGPKTLVLGGLYFHGMEGREGNSDADVVMHALTNAISGISGVNILGAVADEMCKVHSIYESWKYVEAAMETLDGFELVHLSFSIECKRPVLWSFIDEMKRSIADTARLPVNCVGITVTSGEGLTDFGRGLGIQVLCIATARRGT